MDAKSYFGNLRKGSRYSTSVGGSVTGIHGHFIIIDDSDGYVISVLGRTGIEMPTGFQQTGNIADSTGLYG
jgi:hypothetical protein